MLQKFTDERWEEEKLPPLGPPKVNIDSRKKTHKRWSCGTKLVAWVRVYHNPGGLQTVVCFLREGDEIYSYDEQFFAVPTLAEERKR